ncbi:preprotein translocase subunit SecG [Ornithobacterium rhinotracheale]|uniref:Protein-export membrane protein SecG n=1 Tax=Ornithobacterium rhinotracheale (strain ATCC 51463 / DSM 15997 / CCUG 23171 / CIP 104009 / LMG 9086) TaxID=867902 RepID=I4A1B9_ORNRL|nr:preprotein translocase subunit SecG [Ornithobacterium rhinotracheale]AFL97753.1 protein translocase, SecG subunit [Ornithobacterium rhinotracheale DSM 15997]AIQ00775.1 preprotein translocase subunit SecG [Ornithobacterium rhinotracheale ORT-UMN 88]KGB66591.1 preprotein translocase subunit SecG [Ornithobacterium rhinotracheale H06-030791]MCK0193948.1 preprotein translocase subunit SecG [Ornithobacterium rhinotracheale]MCK0200106.1 preprotein translocase subunit SecG [Ornithobacterium rhinotr
MATFIFLMIVIMIVCVLLVMVVLSQNPKGGGLSSTFGGGGSQMFGVQRTNDFLDKSTWTLAILIAVLVILANFMAPRSTDVVSPDIPVKEMPALPQTTDTSVTPNAPAE